MPRITLPIIGAAFDERAQELNPQDSLNMYVAAAPPGSKSRLVLYSVPGLALFAQVSSFGARSNLVEFQDAAYGVWGATLHKITSGGAVTSAGTLNTSGGRVQMVAGRTHLLLVDGTDGYTWDGTTFAAIADADFKQDSAGAAAVPTHCTYQDGFFIVNKAGTDEFAISGLEDATAWATLDFATAAVSPDDILALSSNYKTLYLIGSRTTEPYYNSGNADFPFEPYPGGTMEFGIHAPHSIVRSSVGLFWLASTPEGDVQVVQVNGLSPAVVSDPISWALTEMVKSDDATALVYRWNGRTRYQITFPTEDETWEFIVEDRVWLKRKSAGIGRHRSAGAGYLGDNYLFADYANGKLYELDETAYDEDGDTLERERITQPVHRDNRIIFHRAIHIDVESGSTTVVSGSGSDPQLVLSYSDDGGYTYSSDLSQSMGQIGERTTRVVYRNLGSSRNRIYKLRVTDPAPFTILGGYADIEVGEF